ncbi:hypothetical protein DV735_g711, partial [Chaetothyriales sp. CBS 134920]
MMNPQMQNYRQYAPGPARPSASRRPGQYNPQVKVTSYRNFDPAAQSSTLPSYSLDPAAPLPPSRGHAESRFLTQWLPHGPPKAADRNDIYLRLLAIGMDPRSAQAQAQAQQRQIYEQQMAQRNAAYEHQLAQRRARKPTDRNMPEGVEDVIVGEGVQQYKDLREVERKLDYAMMRKKLDIQDSFSRNGKRQKTMRIWISNTAENQPWQRGPLDENTFDFNTGADSTWKVRLEGKILDEPEDELDGSEAPDQGKKEKEPEKKLSHFFKSFSVEYDKARAVTSLDPSLQVEWKKQPNTVDVDCFEFQRKGDENLNITVNLVRDEKFERFRLSHALASALDMEEADRAEVVMGIWEYVKAMGLQEDEERRTIRCDERLRQIFGTDTFVFPQVADRIMPHLHPLTPVRLPYTIRVDEAYISNPEPTIYDVKITVDDPLRAAKAMAYAQTPASAASLRHISQLDDQIAIVVQAIQQHKAKHTFFKNLAKDPVTFVRKWYASQQHDLSVLLGEAEKGDVAGLEFAKGGKDGVWGSEVVNEAAVAQPDTAGSEQMMAIQADLDTAGSEPMMAIQADLDTAGTSAALSVDIPDDSQLHGDDRSTTERWLDYSASMSIAAAFPSAYDRTAESTGFPTNTQPRRSFTGDENGLLQRLRSKSTSLQHPVQESPTGAADPANPDASGRSSSTQAETDEIEEAKHLARQLSRTSIDSRVPSNPWDYEEGGPTDPASPNFSIKAFTKSLLKLLQTEPDKHIRRSAGFAFRNLNAYGYGAATDYQNTVGNVWLKMFGSAKELFGSKERRIDILQDFEGLVNAGEMLVVLGPPGSGCSTFLKTITGETHGYNVDKNSHINYQGIGFDQMHRDFRGEAIYTAEVDVHFPQMTVGETLYFAARARAPRFIPGGLSKHEFALRTRDVIMAALGIRHTINTRVGNDFIRGVSGGERKRVTIAEACLNGSPLQAWDNSTRGLDAANALEFCRTLRTSTDLSDITAGVAIYQAPQAAYDLFDKVLVIYQGRQIFFGDCKHAKTYFLNMGFDCPERQTTADFLTSMTSVTERKVRPGFEDKVPRTPDEFARRWKESPERAALLEAIDQYDKDHPIGGPDLERFQQSMNLQKSKRQRQKSPYTLDYGQQIRLCLWRGFRRLFADPSLTFTQLFGNFIMSLIIGSVFYNLDNTTNSFFSRGALLFFAILMNAFGSALEILTLYSQRPIVEKHKRYALYHPSAEAFASMLTDMPYKIANAIIANLTLYFMTNLRRTPGAFFFFLLFSFTLTLTMSMMFRTIASVSRSLTQALAPAAILILAIVIYTGFAIPTTYMLGWARWINYLDPVAYGFESLMINEFSNRQFRCAAYVPSGFDYGTGLENRVCTTVGSVAGEPYVSGDAFINSQYDYYASHRWRNLGILFAFMIGLMVFYLVAAETVSAKKSKGEVLVFRRGYTPKSLKSPSGDLESADTGAQVPIQTSGKQEQDVSAIIQKQTAIFQWKNVVYDITIKGEPRRILDHVDGWVKPGTLTALMGVSGAGKTTLLDVLATRVTMGVISGEMLVDGKPRDSSFQRKTGYVQQQDLHLETTTVREALNFSAILRQPAHVSRSEKLAYVDEVIKLLEMEEYADAVVGVPGEGLNVEQRKRLTIGVELAAKPQLLLFLDEPTSGLDSQTSWSILDLLEKLKNNGQAILCTIHQPSAVLFQRFDRLLFLAKGGKTVYFGPIGESSKVLTSYFERNGAFPCPPEANPAEWMLEVIGAAPGSHTEIDWFHTWRDSPEYRAVQDELEQLKEERSLTLTRVDTQLRKAEFREFAAPFGVQLWETLKRVFEQYWRTPSYIYSKLGLVTSSGLFIGFSFFRAPNTQQGLQNQMFGLFMLMTIFGQLTQQIMPLFVTQRSLYEVRERPSKAYSWKAFMLANIIVELPWSTIASVFLFFTWYYPIGLWHNAEPTDTVHERGALMFLLIWAFLIFTSTFADMVIAGIGDAETGGNVANLCFSLCLVFCGVLASPTVLPGFWIFMYRVSPFTYLIEGMLATAVADSTVTCAANEFLHFTPPSGQTCAEYMSTYISAYAGYLEAGTEQSTSNCSFCQLADTNVFLSAVAVNPDNKWRDFGLMWVYIVFNVFAALFFYWWARVPKGGKHQKEENASLGERKPSNALAETEHPVDLRDAKSVDENKSEDVQATAEPEAGAQSEKPAS